VVQSSVRVFACVMRGAWDHPAVAIESNKKLTVTERDVPGLVSIHETIRAQAVTGQRIGSSVHCCVRVSIFLLFFWSSKVIVACLALDSRSWSWCEISILSFEYKQMLPTVRSFVLPRSGMVEYSQLRMVKKNTLIERLAIAA